MTALETAVLDACEVAGEWPEQISAGVCAGVDFAIANPLLVQILSLDGTEENDIRRYEHVVGRLTGFIQIKAPPGTQLPAFTVEALVAGILRLVSDYVCLGRLDRLAELRTELVLLVLLPYLGFPEAQRWANRMNGAHAKGT
jgi:hypothetical protein